MSKMDELLAAALADIERGNFEEAFAALSRLLREDPENAVAQHYRQIAAQSAAASEFFTGRDGSSD